MWRTMAVAIGLLSACFNPQYESVLCSERGQCPHGTVCEADRCVAPGSSPVDAPPTGPPDAECLPGCSGDILITCAAGEELHTECDLGCIADSAPHCAVMIPSNGVTADDLTVVPADRPFVVPAGETYTIDTSTGRIERDDGAQVRPATVSGGLHEGTGTFYARRGETIALFAVDALIIEADAVLRGEGERALVVLSRGDIVVGGMIDVSAGCHSGVGGLACGGPGGGVGATTASPIAGGCAPGGNGAGSPAPDEAGVESGGGGGGLGAAGAAGGRAGTQGMPRTGGSGGAIAGCPGPAAVPLIGGSGGGAGGVGDVNGGVGGGGGGALQLSSLTRITIAGDDTHVALIQSSGAGGTGPVVGAQGGGGGGSGGALLLEAPVIVISGGSAIVANGGGGGSGTVSSSNALANGAAGGISLARAAGGIGEVAENNRGFGGVGGARVGDAGGGGSTLDGTGGGGGGVGLIRINRRTQTINGGAVVSPAHTEGALNVQ